MKNILIILKDIEIRDLVLNILKKYDYFIDTAKPDAKSLENFDFTSQNLIITDILLIKHKTNKSFNKIKKKYPEIKILLITGSGRVKLDININNIFKAGIDNVLHKPFNKEELIGKINELVY